MMLGILMQSLKVTITVQCLVTKLYLKGNFCHCERKISKWAPQENNLHREVKIEIWYWDDDLYLKWPAAEARTRWMSGWRWWRASPPAFCSSQSWSERNPPGPSSLILIKPVWEKCVQLLRLQWNSIFYTFIFLNIFSVAETLLKYSRNF